MVKLQDINGPENDYQLPLTGLGNSHDTWKTAVEKINSNFKAMLSMFGVESTAETVKAELGNDVIDAVNALRDDIGGQIKALALRIEALENKANVPVPAMAPPAPPPALPPPSEEPQTPSMLTGEPEVTVQEDTASNG